MKQFNVSNDCICCGACIASTNLLTENEEGKAIPVNRGYISDKFLPEAENIIANCPVNAISIVETGISSAKGEGLLKLANSLEGKLNAITIPKIEKKTVAFNANDYHFSYSGPQGEYRAVYSSYDKAKRAGLEELNRIVYSQMDRFSLDALAQYKVNKLRPFYTFDENSFYIQMNSKFEKVLSDFANEAESLSNGEIKFSKDFTTFNAFTEEKDDAVDFLAHFESYRIQSVVKDQFKSDPYRLQDYDTYMDVNDEETYEGESWLGNPKYKTRYYYQDILDAAEEFMRDFKNALNYVDIDEKGVNTVNACINRYRKFVEKLIKIKVNEFKNTISNFTKKN